MTVLVNGEEKRIGLALSGGGYRAAAFHLGTMRKLKEMGILDKLDVFSCVSGGSIAGAYYCLHRDRPSVFGELEDFLKTRSIAVSSVVGGILNPFATRLDALAATYDRHLFHNKTLADLRDGPRVYFNATNLSTGNLFSYIAGGLKNELMSDWELEQSDASDQKISAAVAASSSFPPVFPPHKVTEMDFENLPTEFVTLTDGGVYDNLGVNPLMLKDINDLDYAIVSDAGKPFEIRETPTESGTGVLLEAIGILMEQVRGLQFRRLDLAHKSGEGPKPVWFSIDREASSSIEGDAEFASSISTNLKKLSETEFRILSRHAATLCEARLKRWAPELVSNVS